MGGKRQKWVGIGFVEDGPLKGDEPLVLDEHEKKLKPLKVTTYAYVLDVVDGTIIAKVEAPTVELTNGEIPNDALLLAIKRAKKTGRTIVVARAIAYV